MCQLNELRHYCCRLRLIRLNEVSVERLHRMASLALNHAPHAEGAYISLYAGRRAEIVEHILGDTVPRIADPGVFSDLCVGLRSPPNMVRALELDMHHCWVNAPNFKIMRGQQWQPRTAFREMASMFYRYDMHSMFQTREAAKQAFDDHSSKRRKALQSGSGGPLLLKELAVPHQLKVRYAYDHFRRHSANDMVYTLPSHVPLALLSGVLVGTSASACLLDDDDGLLDDVAIDPAAVTSAPLFNALRIVHRRPGSQRLFPSMGSQLRSDHMAVEVFDLVIHKRNTKTMTMQKAKGTLGTTHLVSLDTFAELGCNLFPQIRGWDILKREYMLEDVPPGCDADAMNSLVTSMVSCGAYEGPLSHCTPFKLHCGIAGSISSCLDVLLELNLAKRLDNGCVCLIEQALTQVKCTFQVGNARPGLERRSVPLEEYSMWELISALEEQGWQFQTRPGRNKCKPLALTDPIPKERRVAYLRDASVPRSYLLCLHKHDELRGRGHEEIKHGQTVKYYAALLSPTSAAELALEDDGHEIVDALAIEDVFQDELPGDIPDDGCGGDAASWSSLEDDFVEAGLEPSEAAVASGAGGASAALSFSWGGSALHEPFRFHRVVRPGYTGYEVHCPHHRDRDPLGNVCGPVCRKTLQYKGEADHDEVVRRLKAWCLLGRFENHRKLGRKRGHLRCPLAARDDCDLEADLAAAVACGVWLVGLGDESSGSESD